MKKVGIGIGGVAMFFLVALAIVGGVSLYLTWAIPDPNFNFDWEVDPGAEREDIRRVQIPLPPMWTPNSQHIVFNANDQMHAVDLSAMSLYSFRPVQELSFEHAGSISNSGSIALTQRGYTHDEFGKDKQEIETVEIDGANRRLVIAGDPHYYPYHPVWSPNGDFIAFLTTWNPYGMRLHIMDIVDGDASNVSVRALDITAHLTPPVWSNSGSLIAFVSKESPDEVMDYRYVTHVVNRASTGYARLAETASSPAWSPDDNRLAFVRNEDDVSTIYTIEPGGANLQEVASLPDVLPELEGSWNNYPLGGRDRLPRGHVSWSFDGSEIRLHQSPFVVVNADGSNLRMMRGRPDALASWSPDESQIAVYLPGHEVRLFTMNADGTNKQSLVRWDSGSGELVADRRPFDIDGFDWEAYPSAEGER